MKIKILAACMQEHLKQSCGILAVVLTLLIELLSRKSLPGLLKFVVLTPHIFFYNCMIIGITLLTAFLFRRRLFVVTLISLLWLAAGVVNSILLVFRTTPFTAVDLKLLKYALSLLGNYLRLWQIVLLAAVIVLCAVFLIIAFKKSPKYEGRLRYGKIIKGLVIIGLAVYGLTSLGMETGILAKNFGNLQEGYHTYGFAYCFSNSLLNTGISRPKNYSEEVIAEIESADSEKEQVPDTTSGEIEEEADTGMPNIIFVQLESFFDPQQVKGVTLSEDPIPYFRELMDNYSSGFLSVPSVGAGTANTEFEVITGMNLDFFGPGEYPYKTVLKETTCESISYDLKELGYRTHAIHNNEGTFYDRHIVFSQLGFDTFTPIEYMEDYECSPIDWPKDKVLTGYIKKALDATEGKDFIYTITVQSHGAYPTGDEAKTLPIQASGMPTEESDNGFTYFVNQLNEVDAFIEELVGMLQDRKERTVLVLYGDHLPSFEFTEESLKNENLFQTNYVVWDNFGLQREIRDIEAYQLSAVILDRLDMNIGTMIRYHQRYLKEPYEEEKYMEKMNLLEYDLLYGEKEALGREQYEPADLQMGITPIRLNQVKTRYGVSYFYGSNFTPSSQVFVDGKPADTVFVSTGLLVVKGLEFVPGAPYGITVKQVGRDKIALGSTEVFWYKE